MATPQDKMTDQEALQLAATDYLGKGYRGWEYYADPRSCTEKIFDLIEKNAWAEQKTESFTHRVVSGKTITEYFNKLSSDINLTGEYSGFTATVTATFSKDVLKKSTIEYATLLDTAWYRRLWLQIPKLRPEAQSAIDKMDGPELFKLYGTHYTRSIYLGARVFYSSYLDRESTTSNTDLGLTLKAEYLKLARGGAGGKEVSKAEQEQVAKNATLSVVGGDPSEAPSVGVIGDPAEFSKTYKEWSKSIWPNHVSIADFDKGGLVPLYELAATPARRAALQTEWTQYMRDNTQELLLSPQPTAPQQQVCYGGDFYLRYEDGTYLSALERLDRGAVNTALKAFLTLMTPLGAIALFADQTEYYPTLRASGRVKLTFAGGKPGSPVQTGAFVQLVTGEREKNTGFFGKEYTHLGAWPGETCVYYYTPGYAESQDWIVQKVTGGKEYASVNFGDRVFLTNRSYPGQRLCSAPGQFMAKNLTLLTTRETSAGVWTLEPA